MALLVAKKHMTMRYEYPHRHDRREESLLAIRLIV
jgi:hypothetical protein